MRARYVCKRQSSLGEEQVRSASQSASRRTEKCRAACRAPRRVAARVTRTSAQLSAGTANVAGSMVRQSAGPPSAADARVCTMAGTQALFRTRSTRV